MLTEIFSILPDETFSIKQDQSSSHRSAEHTFTDFITTQGIAQDQHVCMFSSFFSVRESVPALTDSMSDLLWLTGGCSVKQDVRVWTITSPHWFHFVKPGTNYLATVFLEHCREIPWRIEPWNVSNHGSMFMPHLVLLNLLFLILDIKHERLCPFME